MEKLKGIKGQEIELKVGDILVFQNNAIAKIKEVNWVEEEVYWIGVDAKGTKYSTTCSIYEDIGFHHYAYGSEIKKFNEAYEK